MPSTSTPPPFRKLPFIAAVEASGTASAFDPGATQVPTPLSQGDAAAPNRGRRRLVDLDAHLHCSVIGTCLSTTELRRLMGPFMPVADATDLEVHHEAVRLVSHDSDVARMLDKALDRRHEPILQRFARCSDLHGLEVLWKGALKSGDIPGAYWAILTHRRADEPLRKLAFGDVHMLSHLVGASNRADIRRLVELEAENGCLRSRNDEQHQRIGELVAGRQQDASEREVLCLRIESLQASLAKARAMASPAQSTAQAMAASELVIETQRRKAAETRAREQVAEIAALRRQLEQRDRHSEVLERELELAEAALRAGAGPAEAGAAPLEGILAGRRVYYVGGRPASHHAIRALVEHHGGEYQRHDGGIEDRKGLLAAGLAWADVVVFPVDCIDHDSAGLLKRSCVQQGRPFIPLRSASVTSFVAGLVARFDAVRHASESRARQVSG